MKIKSFAAAVAVAGSVAAGAATAAPVTFEFVSTVQDTEIPWTMFGDTVVFSIFADNGAMSLFDQSWDSGDYLGATASIGTAGYTATFDVELTDFSATTDALGNVTSFVLRDASSGNADSNGGNPEIVLNGIRNNLFSGRLALDSADLTTPENFTVSSDMQPVPLPASLPLLALGLGGLGFVARRKRKAA